MILTALGQFPEAREAFEEAHTIHKELSQANRGIMPVAGLAELALSAGDPEEARAHTEAIITHLDEHELDYTDESLAVYMSAFHVLRLTGDGRADALLQMALNHLQKRADSIKAENDKQRFWDALPHRAVAEAAAIHIPQT